MKSNIFKMAYNSLWLLASPSAIASCQSSHTHSFPAILRIPVVSWGALNTLPTQDFGTFCSLFLKHSFLQISSRPSFVLRCQRSVPWLHYLKLYPPSLLLLTFVFFESLIAYHYLALYSVYICVLSIPALLEYVLPEDGDVVCFAYHLRPDS